MVNETMTGQLGGVAQGFGSFTDTITDVLRNIHGVIVGFSPENAFFINVALAGIIVFVTYKYAKTNTWIYLIIGTLAFLLFSLLQGVKGG